MKSTYTAPKLTSLGNVAEITQILGSTNNPDFTFLNGSVISGNNDIGSASLNCTGTLPTVTCTKK
jgi:hypothetical protein